MGELGDPESPHRASVTIEPHDTYQALESGQILELTDGPALLEPADIAILRAQRQGSSRFHKNVSFRPSSDAIRGLADASQREPMRRIMRRYGQAVTALLSRLAPGYAAGWSLDYASFRPIEEQGRELPALRRNDLLHIDAFPTRPTQGGRILRFFTNISIDQPRIWNTGPAFPLLAERWAMAAGLADQRRPWSRLRDRLQAASHHLLLGMGPPRRTPYDRFMLRFHDFLKQNQDVQRSPEQRQRRFAPGTSWVVFSDAVPHAVLSGCFALEQTFIVPVTCMRHPELAPIRVLERLCGQALA